MGREEEQAWYWLRDSVGNNKIIKMNFLLVNIKEYGFL